MWLAAVSTVFLQVSEEVGVLGLYFLRALRAGKWIKDAEDDAEETRPPST